MIGVVLVTHGRLAFEMLEVVHHVAGPQEGVECVGINPDDDMEVKRQEIIEKSSKVDTGDGAIVVTDMFGGTPSNLAISIMEERNIEVISGMNIPMLVKLMGVRNETVPDAVAMAQEAGRKYINIASQLLKLDS